MTPAEMRQRGEEAIIPSEDSTEFDWLTRTIWYATAEI